MRNSARFVVLILCLSILTVFSACTHHSEVPKGNVLHLVLISNVRTTDPTSAYDTTSAQVVYQIYETPYQYDYFSPKPKIIPMLADGMPKISKDRLTYTFKIKKGIHFQNDPCFKATHGKGRELKAQDFIYAWKRHADPKNQSQGFWTLDGKIVGINKFQKDFDHKPEAQVMNETVPGMRALNDYTIQLKFTRPYPQMNYIMAMSFMAPVPKECVKYYGADFVNHPIGTGPFMVKEYDPTSRIILVKNPNYRKVYFPPASQIAPKYKSYAKYSGKRLPLANAIVFTVLKEEQPRWLGFLDGKYDMIEIPKDDYGAAIEKKNRVKPALKKKGIYVSIEPSPIYWYISMNMQDKLLGSNKYLRQAIASAINTKEWLHIFSNDRGELQTEVDPPSIPDRCGKPYRWTYNLARARALLKKAGYPGGKGLPTFRFDMEGANATFRQRGEFFQKDLAQVGIHIDPIENTFPAYLDKTHTGNLQIDLAGWDMDYPDAENNYQLLYGPNKAPGPNQSNFENAQYDKIYEKMKIMRSGPARRKLICKLENIIQENAPWAYGYYENEYRLAQGWLKNFHTAELVYSKWKYIAVDQALKKKLTR